jgi:hypothetical protein
MMKKFKQQQTKAQKKLIDIGSDDTEDSDLIEKPVALADQDLDHLLKEGNIMPVV